MAIFGKERTRQAQGHGATIIAAGSKFVGNLTLTDNLHIDGSTEGDIASEATVIIGSEGRTEGRIKACHVIVSGRLNGSIETERLEIIAGGSVEGEVRTVDLVIEPGGRFNGSSEILDKAQQQLPAPVISAPDKNIPGEKQDGRKNPKKDETARVGAASST